MSVPAWEPDPTGRHQYRWWDGAEWTDQVADDGNVSSDPIDGTSLQGPVGPSGGTAGQGTGSLPDPMMMLSSKGRRFWAWILEGLLGTVTFGIGWIIWTLFILERGQTPAKQFLRMRVVRLSDNPPPVVRWMAMREFLLKGQLFGALAGATAFFPNLGLIVAGVLTAWTILNGFVLLFSRNGKRQTLWDRWQKTVVITDREGLFRPNLPKGSGLGRAADALFDREEIFGSELGRKPEA